MLSGIVWKFFGFSVLQISYFTKRAWKIGAAFEGPDNTNPEAFWQSID